MKKELGRGVEELVDLTEREKKLKRSLRVWQQTSRKQGAKRKKQNVTKKTVEIELSWKGRLLVNEFKKLHLNVLLTNRSKKYAIK